MHAGGARRMSARKIAVLVAFVAIVPGSLVFVNEGASLAAVETVGQVAGPRVLGSFALLGFLVLLPAILKAARKRRNAGASQ